MKIKKELNLVELASETASTLLLNVLYNSGWKQNEIFVEEDGVSTYTEEAQDIFNEYYDEIYEYLENKGFKHVND
jgi:hypothetical protein